MKLIGMTDTSNNFMHPVQLAIRSASICFIPAFDLASKLVEKRQAALG